MTLLTRNCNTLVSLLKASNHKTLLVTNFDIHVFVSMFLNSTLITVKIVFSVLFMYLIDTWYDSFHGTLKGKLFNLNNSRGKTVSSSGVLFHSVDFLRQAVALLWITYPLDEVSQTSCRPIRRRWLFPVTICWLGWEKGWTTAPFTVMWSNFSLKVPWVSLVFMDFHM